MIDFHCHLDLYPDHQSAVDKREKEKTYTLTVTTTPLAWPQNRDFTKGKRYVRAALGLHPQLVGERYSEISIWKKHLPETRYVGEVGLDGSPKYKSSYNLQKSIFTEILQTCAEAGDKILSIHSVRASKDVLELLKINLPINKGRVVLHWFTGTKKQAIEAAERGYFFSVNADMLHTKRGREIVSALPINCILTETDSPFTHFPSIEQAIELLAEILDLPKSEISRIVSNNLKSILT